ncbi:MAG: S41 family peptidase [Planctomycetota bacterium]|jgi:C-terminal processing protease CtpA/Prc
MLRCCTVIGWLSILLLAPTAFARSGVYELKHDTGKQDGKQSIAGTGHIVTFKVPKALYIASVRVFGQRYGGGYDPSETFFTVTVCDSNLKELTSQKAPYDLFTPRKFEWGDVVLENPVKVAGTFKIVVAFRPTQTKGVYLAWSTVKTSHSSTGLPGGREDEIDKSREWMIRAVLTKKKPKTSKKPAKPSKPKKKYLEDFRFLEKTVRNRFPALAKKKVDWRKVCKAWEPKFKGCTDDKTHILNAHRLLAVLGDMHSGITKATVEAHVPSFDNLYGGGIWIATDRGRLVFRAMLPGHPFEGKVKPGAELIRIGDRPARIAHEEVRARMKTWHGWSSTHFLDARLSFQFFRFEKERLPLTFLNPDGSKVEVTLAKWGPGGRGLSRVAVTLPEGLEAQGSAVSKKLEAGVGYVRILGGMNQGTQDAFFKALDELKGMKGILLDCRGMGGGGDRPAWAMAGRFFEKRTSNGRNGWIEPTGSWQFKGPVVMLQDEREVSSAETFTWAMTETERVVSVGRPTGGATIIPQSFEVPSGLFRFRLGCTDRLTPIRGVQPEGIGTPPDIFVPYEPVLFNRHNDPIFAVGLDVLLLLMQGAPKKTVMDAVGGLLGGETDRFAGAYSAFSKLPPPKKSSGYRDITDGIMGSIVSWEVTLLNAKDHPLPTFKGSVERLQALARIAEQLGEVKTAERARKASQGWEKEIEAEEAFANLVVESFPPEKSALQKFLRKHGKTRYGKACAKAFRQ